MSRTGLIEEMVSHLDGWPEAEMVTFASLTHGFIVDYAFAYQLPGTIQLVLDNSIVQSFKHRKTQPHRRAAALAHIAFCRFVKGWSDRPSRLAISPLAVFENGGCNLPANVHEAATALETMVTLLADTGLPIFGIGFSDAASLLQRLRDVAHDEIFLSDHFRTIDGADWRLPKPEIGVPIPFFVAWEAISEKLPLRYFDQDYVREILAARVEKHMIEQSQYEGEPPLPSIGAPARALRKLNSFNKAGLLKGLGDIDMLQNCDISRQFLQEGDTVLLGQSLDRGLADVLREKTSLSVRSPVIRMDAANAAQRVVDSLLKRHFAAEDERFRTIAAAAQSFEKSLFDACHAALERKR